MKIKKLCVILSLLLSLSLVFATTTTSFAEDYDDGEEYISYDEEDWDWDWEDEEDEPEEPEYDINPATNIKFSNIKYNSATVTWKNPGDIDGYDIYTCIEKDIIKGNKFDREYKDELLTTIEDPNITSYHLKHLVPQEYYEIDVVSYKYIDGVKQSADLYSCSDTFETPMCMKGKFYTSNKKGGRNVIKVLKAYKYDQKFKGPGECYGYAEWASNKIAKSRTYVTINKKITLKNVKKYIIGLKPGAHVRMTSKRMDHSILILKATKDRIYWADNNFGSYNRVHYHAGTLVDLYCMMSGYSKIAWIYKTKTYR